VKERTILFNGETVRAILDGRKTMTRRVVKQVIPDMIELSEPDDPDFASSVAVLSYKPSLWNNGAMRWFVGASWGSQPCPVRDADKLPILTCPYGQPGDRLWVREAFTYSIDDGIFQYDKNGNHVVLYRSDEKQVVKDDGDGGIEYNKNGKQASPWYPSIHMPRWASRITLEIVTVCVERVRDITEKDAKSEGCLGRHPAEGTGDCVCTSPTAKERFAYLWDSINAKRGYGWDKNPWVWVVEFRRGK
jgi:hypothetical protein